MLKILKEVSIGVGILALAIGMGALIGHLFGGLNLISGLSENEPSVGSRAALTVLSSNHRDGSSDDLADART